MADLRYTSHDTFYILYICTTNKEGRDSRRIRPVTCNAHGETGATPQEKRDTNERPVCAETMSVSQLPVSVEGRGLCCMLRRWRGVKLTWES